MGSITRKKRPTLEARRAAVEADVLAAMERLLESGRSFTELSVEELARAAGISRSYFYMNFRDKSALVKVLMARVGDELLTSTGLWFQEPNITARKSLEQAMLRIIGIYEQHQAILRAVVETALYDEEIAALYERMMSGLIAESRKAALQLKKSGRANSDLNPAIAEVLTWMVERLCGLYVGSSRAISKEKLAKTFTHIIWHSYVAVDADNTNPTVRPIARKTGKN